MLQAGRSPVRLPDEVDFINLPNSSSPTLALGSTQPLTEMSSRNFPGGKKRPARRADNLAAICEPNIWKCGSLHGLYRENSISLLYLQAMFRNSDVRILYQAITTMQKWSFINKMTKTKYLLTNILSVIFRRLYTSRISDVMRLML
jgi:hypothetical protein